jgi:signal transduction histidine kinase
VAPPPQAQVQQAAPAARPVEIAIAPPEWRIAAVGADPAMVLVRRVDTPDGALTQGLVLDRDAVVAGLAERAEGRTVALFTSTPSPDQAAALAARARLALGAAWVGVDVRPSLARAAIAAVDVERGFLARLIPIAVLALACGVLVVVLVARAERRAQQRAQFAASAAHELRTPLAGLQLYGDMLADGLGDPGKQRDYARRMAEEASRLGRVLSNVLGFSQLERGNLSVHPTPHDAVAVARAALERGKAALERAGVEVVLDTPAVELTARLDEDAALRILGNLLDNAEKYGRGPEARTVRVSVDQRGDRVEIAVADAGPGVVERQRARLFRPFWRGVAGDGPAGLGLGLALSRSLARAMGGDLLYRPTPGGGATFVLSLAEAR